MVAVCLDVCKEYGLTRRLEQVLYSCPASADKHTVEVPSSVDVREHTVDVSSPRPETCTKACTQAGSHFHGYNEH